MKSIKYYMMLIYSCLIPTTTIAQTVNQYEVKLVKSQKPGFLKKPGFFRTSLLYKMLYMMLIYSCLIPTTTIAQTVNKYEVKLVKSQKPGFLKKPGFFRTSLLYKMLYMMLIYSCLIPKTTIAQTVNKPQPDNTPLEVKLLTTVNNQKNVITINSVNQKQLTVPSLWWIQEQMGGNLLNYWLAYPQKKRIDVVVNRTRWNALPYIDKYSFVHGFGSKIFQKYGYNTRIFIINRPQNPIATYTCNLQSNLSDCHIIIGNGKEGLRLPRN